MPRSVDHSKHPAIIDLILAGKTTREIAAELSCSLTTIRLAGCCQQCSGPKTDIKNDISNNNNISIERIPVPEYSKVETELVFAITQSELKKLPRWLAKRVFFRCR